MPRSGARTPRPGRIFRARAAGAAAGGTAGNMVTRVGFRYLLVVAVVIDAAPVRFDRLTQPTREANRAV
jgi:hypothetical protein